MIIIVMGVLGAGKTTVGSLLARELGFEFHDADSFHSAANIEKMRRGIPLTDSDRGPWLDSLRQAMQQWSAQGKNIVLACSALKKAYRQRLLINSGVKLVYIKADYELIQARLQNRHGHFAGQQLVASQFTDLEEPQDAIVVDGSRSPAEIVQQLRAALGGAG
ncbi:MAG TPA: gluconokinase [Terriglobales bacterium]